MLLFRLITADSANQLPVDVVHGWNQSFSSDQKEGLEEATEWNKYPIELSVSEVH